MVFEAPTASVDRRQLIEHITGTGMVTTTGRWRGPAPDAEELLRVEGLTQAGVVEDASFSLRAGDVLGIAGLVGAGRTELVRMIFGADPSTSGRVLVRGKPVRLRGPRDGMRAGIVLLPEDRRHQGTVATFSVRKNMTLPTLARFRASPVLPFPSPARERATARDLVERLGIKVRDTESPIRNLSGGNQQKVVLAKWLDSKAEIFIFDEPTHGIDVGCEGGGLRAPPRARRVGQGRRLHLLGVPRARRHVQPRARHAGGPARRRVRGRRRHRERARRALLRGLTPQLPGCPDVQLWVHARTQGSSLDSDGRRCGNPRHVVSSTERLVVPTWEREASVARSSATTTRSQSSGECHPRECEGGA